MEINEERRKNGKKFENFIKTCLHIVRSWKIKQINKNRKLEHENQNLSSTWLYHQKTNFIVKKPLGNALTSLLFVLGLQHARNVLTSLLFVLGLHHARQKKELFWTHAQFADQSLPPCSWRIRMWNIAANR